MSSKLPRTLVSAAITVGVMIATPTSADAAHDDSFGLCTESLTGGCDGRVRFVDHGEGRPGGGSNDDYIVCEDNDDFFLAGCWLWHNGVFRGGVISSGDGRVVWEPYQYWNVKPGDTIGIKVCVQREPIEDNDWRSCTSITRTSVDG